MEIKRTLDTATAKYDFLNLTEQDFNTLCRAYEYYMHYIQHCPPKDDDAMWNKMRKLAEDRITIV